MSVAERWLRDWAYSNAFTLAFVCLLALVGWLSFLISYHA
jgi:hypothetical protein